MVDFCFILPNSINLAYRQVVDVVTQRLNYRLFSVDEYHSLADLELMRLYILSFHRSLVCV